MAPIGKLLVALGLGIVALGGLILLADRLPWLRLGRLPGDIRFERESFRLYLPITTSILVSVVLSAILWLLSRRR